MVNSGFFECFYSELGCFEGFSMIYLECVSIVWCIFAHVFAHFCLIFVSFFVSFFCLIFLSHFCLIFVSFYIHFRRCLQYSVLKGTMWLKFLIIWRFFRLFSLMDGVSAPENMERCMSNNQTFSGFWRSWHASFNIFNIRFVGKWQKKNHVPPPWFFF
jgi:D-alanyl-lipoteichoic acid acyltransferase DltB (MBOAT superfamily)